MIFNFSDYPYLKDKKELLDKSIDDSFNYIIDTYFKDKYKMTDEFIVSFITDLKKKLYLFYRNNKIATIDDEDIKELFYMYLTFDLVNDIPKFNYYYELGKTLLTKIHNKGGYEDYVNYTDDSTDKSSTTSSSSINSTSNREGKATSTSNDSIDSLSKNANTPTITSPSSTFVDTYANAQQKDTTSSNGTSDTTTTNNDTNSTEGTSKTDKDYSREFTYNKSIEHKELESLSKELDNISKVKNNIVKYYIDVMRDCFITLQDLYDLYEGDE